MWKLAVLCCVFAWVGHESPTLVYVNADQQSNGVYSSTILTGNHFIVDWNRTSLDSNNYIMLLLTNQTNGAPLLNGPELQVVANTIVYFSLNATWAPTDRDSVAFGLITSLTELQGFGVGTPCDPLGLTPTQASLSAGSCTTVTPGLTARIYPNSWALNFTGIYPQPQVFSTTPCVIQWLVPPYDNSTNATKYYYLEPYNPSYPRQIHIVDGPALPATPSPSGSGSASGTGSGSGNNNTTTSPPTTPAPSGTSSPSSTSPSSSSSSSSSTGSNVPASGFHTAPVCDWAALVVALLAIVGAAAASC